MAERIWDKFLTEQDKEHLAASEGRKKRVGFGKKTVEERLDGRTGKVVVYDSMFWGKLITLPRYANWLPWMRNKETTGWTWAMSICSM